MDPDANLREQREIAARIMRIVDNVNDDGSYKPGQQEDLANLAYRLAELVQALDEWLSKRGFLPKAWEVQKYAGAAPLAAEPRRVSDAARRTARKVQP